MSKYKRTPTWAVDMAKIERRVIARYIGNLGRQDWDDTQALHSEHISLPRETWYNRLRRIYENLVARYSRGSSDRGVQRPTSRTGRISGS